MTKSTTSLAKAPLLKQLLRTFPLLVIDDRDSSSNGVGFVIKPESRVGSHRACDYAHFDHECEYIFGIQYDLFCLLELYNWRTRFLSDSKTVYVYPAFELRSK